MGRYWDTARPRNCPFPLPPTVLLLSSASKIPRLAHQTRNWHSKGSISIVLVSSLRLCASPLCGSGGISVNSRVLDRSPASCGGQPGPPFSDSRGNYFMHLFRDLRGAEVHPLSWFSMSFHFGFSVNFLFVSSNWCKWISPYSDSPLRLICSFKFGKSFWRIEITFRSIPFCNNAQLHCQHFSSIRTF